MGGQPVEERLVELFKRDKYRDLIARAVLSNRRSVPVDFPDIAVFDSGFASALLEHPDRHLAVLDAALTEQVRIEFPEQFGKRFRARVRGLPEALSVRAIRSAHLGRLVMVDGIVVRATTVRPVVVRAFYRCRNCGREYDVEGWRGAPRCSNPRCAERRPAMERLEEKTEDTDS
ncbi:MAG: hypothetical protein N3H32_01870, partial [Nitrososphaeria archaeon]|nr:hypothetical protein [Nitrososphaeria archaeon]